MHDGRREAIAACPEYPYLRIQSVDVYRRVFDRLASASNVTLAMGKTILGVRETADWVEVATSGGEFAGLRAFDSSGRGPGVASPGAGRRPASLLQHFFGRTIRVDRPTFDPSTPSLMDFRTSQADGPHFVYLLPLSETEALVENTYLFPFTPPAGRHRHEIAEYLRMRYGVHPGSCEVLEEESGAIPMTTVSVPDAMGSRVTPIGLAGGAARPSSSYTFLRIQRQARTGPSDLRPDVRAGRPRRRGPVPERAEHATRRPADRGGPPQVAIPLGGRARADPRRGLTGRGRAVRRPPMRSRAIRR